MGYDFSVTAFLRASQLRADLALRNRLFARNHPHVESYGSNPVIVYAPENGRHDRNRPDVELRGDRESPEKRFDRDALYDRLPPAIRKLQLWAQAQISDVVDRMANGLGPGVDVGRSCRDQAAFDRLNERSASAKA